MSRRVLAADIGGTHTRLQLAVVDQHHIKIEYEHHYPSADYPCFDDILLDFLSRCPAHPSHACLALAGPVTNVSREQQTGQVTRLPWRLDNLALAHNAGLEQVKLINDFEAIGFALAGLGKDDLACLQGGTPESNGIRAVIGAGTGLGQAIVIPADSGDQVLATEGGHVDFAPQTPEQEHLLRDMLHDYGHVSYDRVVCGKGLAHIYRFLQSRRHAPVPEEIQERLRNDRDPAPAITRIALDNSDATARQALEMFISIYGAQAGNLALNCLPTGGLYLAGGITGHISSLLTDDPFLTAFRRKGRMSELMQRFPVYRITHPQPGLLGAALVAAR